jgi:hypothetical protein
MAPQVPEDIKRMMATREWRMHHFLWHEIRNGWLLFDDATKDTIRQLGWEPPRPARTMPDANGQSGPNLTNDSGEDFLYMHRQMIGTVNAELARIHDSKYPRVQGWASLPRPGDSDYPVPPAWETGDRGLDDYLADVKSDATFNSSFRPWQKMYTDRKKLAAWSLGELGARLEFTIHNQMHMRWCSEPAAGMRPDIDVTHPETIDGRWDDVGYDWLGDTYSSHVNSVFWKVHGWVDNCIEDWKKAHKVTGEIAWTGTWLGKPMAEAPAHSFLAAFAAHSGHGGHEHHGGSMEEMEKLLSIVARQGRFCHFYDKVKLPD